MLYSLFFDYIRPLRTQLLEAGFQSFKQKNYSKGIFNTSLEELLTLKIGTITTSSVGGFSKIAVLNYFLNILRKYRRWSLFKKSLNIRVNKFSWEKSQPYVCFQTFSYQKSLRIFFDHC